MPLPRSLPRPAAPPVRACAGSVAQLSKGEALAVGEALGLRADLMALYSRALCPALGPAATPSTSAGSGGGGDGDSYGTGSGEPAAAAGDEAGGEEAVDGGGAVAAGGAQGGQDAAPLLVEAREPLLMRLDAGLRWAHRLAPHPPGDAATGAATRQVCAASVAVCHTRVRTALSL